MDERLASELRTLFAAELEEHVAAVNRDLLALERARPGETGELLRSLLRTAHTVKGSARAASAPTIERAGHVLEDVLVAVRDGAIPGDGNLFTVLFETTDAVASAGERFGSGHPADDARLLALIERMQGLVAQRSDPVPAVPPLPTPVQGSTADGATFEGSTAAAHVIRVAVEKADQLLALSEELVAALRRGDTEVRELQAHAAALDEAIRRLRMVPFSEGITHLQRAARDVAAASGKEVELEIEGEELEVDRAVLDALRDPLLHLVRNAVDHGIETPEARVAAGKSARGTVTVGAEIRGGDLHVTVRDDGRGLDLEAIRTRLRETGLPVPEDESDLADAVFSPGFSTARMLTDVSGRGLGLDIVRSTVEAMGGIISLESGGMTCFSMRVPLTLSKMRALEVLVGEHSFLIPTASVRLLARIAEPDIHQVRGADAIVYQGRPIPLTSLAAALDLPPPARAPGTKIPVIVLSHGADVAVAVDRLVEEREVVVKGLGRRLQGGRLVRAAALLPSGRVALILHVPDVVDRARGGSTMVRAQVSPDKAVPKKRVLLVDDSITTRALEKSILEAAGYFVATAINGAEGWRLLQEMQGIDVIVSDVEMPELDGFGLCERVRASARFKDLPVVLVTALARPEDRARGLAAGASAYVVKSAFDQEKLLDLLERLV
jgi:two-component system chemotaxis sensor kinase CheA